MFKHTIHSILYVTTVYFALMFSVPHHNIFAKPIIGLCMAAIAFCGLCYTVSAQTISYTTNWRGYITINNNALPFLVHISHTNASSQLTGTSESPRQTTQQFQLYNISLTDSTTHFEFNAGYGNTIFNGLVHGDTIDGSYIQNKLTGDFQVISYSKQVDTLKDKQPSPEFAEENILISYEHLALSGTLAKPTDGVRHPLVILISMNGTQDRDESVFGFKPFKILSDELAAHGFAVLRLDDRGMSKQLGKIAEPGTYNELAKDIAQAINYMRARGDVDGDHIALLGHGEGATLAAMAAAKDNSIRCIIALSAPAAKGSEMLMQELDSAREKHMPAALYELNKKTLTYYFTHFSLTQPDDTMQAYLSAMLAAKYHSLTHKEKKKYADSADYVKYMSAVNRAQLFSRAYRSYIRFDPLTAWKHVGCSVLAIYAGKDKQVPLSLNKPLLENTLLESGNLLVDTKTFNDANHLYQKASTGLPSEYTQLPKEFVPGLTDYIIQWLKGKL